MLNRWIGFFSIILTTLGSAAISFASEDSRHLDLTSQPAGYLSLLIFILAYAFVMAEEITHLRKSKPAILAASIIWALIAYVYKSFGIPHATLEAIRHCLLEYAELFFFLLVAMTYINTLTERGVFEVMRAFFVNKGFSYRALFLITGVLAFFISPFADNLTTALIMCAIVMAVGKDNVRFVNLACINIVVAANAGGAFSPFGDITTLMLWQNGLIDFSSFFRLFLPSLVNYTVPAAIIYLAVPKESPPPVSVSVTLRRGAGVIMTLFLLTIFMAVAFHQFLDLPPVVGMMAGLGLLQLFGCYLKKTHEKAGLITADPFNIFSKVAMAEWDTLLFFYGIVLCVGGLGFIGYLDRVSHLLYTGLGATSANLSLGLLSSFVDNIPVMYAILTIHPDMSLGQWLFVTLTTGVGGSLLSIGSAAGVALMGASGGRYTFLSHLKWAPVILLGYILSCLTHILINSSTFSIKV